MLLDTNVIVQQKTQIQMNKYTSKKGCVYNFYLYICMVILIVLKLLNNNFIISLEEIQKEQTLLFPASEH